MQRKKTKTKIKPFFLPLQPAVYVWTTGNFTRLPPPPSPFPLRSKDEGAEDLLHFQLDGRIEDQGKNSNSLLLRKNSTYIIRNIALACWLYTTLLRKIETEKGGKVWLEKILVLFLHPQTQTVLLYMGKCCTASSLRILQGLTAAKVVGCSGAMQWAYPPASLAQLARARDL